VPAPLDAVIFDLDGTLLDSERVMRVAMTGAAADLGYALDDDAFAAMIGVHHDGNRLFLANRYGEGFPLDAFYEGARVRFREGTRGGPPLRPGVVALLDHLRGMGLPLAVATSTSSPQAETHLAEVGLLDRFDTVVTRSHVLHAKPAPEPYLLAAQRLGVRPTHCLAIEDSPTGVRAAHAAGMATIMVPDLLPADAETRARTVAVVESLTEVIDLLVEERA
jgi:HAD superfamily hydrolase (TIGR01509 family)